MKKYRLPIILIFFGILLIILSLAILEQGYEELRWNVLEPVVFSPDGRYQYYGYNTTGEPYWARDKKRDGDNPGVIEYNGESLRLYRKGTFWFSLLCRKDYPNGIPPVFHIKIKTKNYFEMMIVLKNDKGAWRYIEYRSDSSYYDRILNSASVEIGVGRRILTGDWKEIWADLKGDLSKVFPGEKMTYLYRIDFSYGEELELKDIRLYNKLPEGKSITKPDVYNTVSKGMWNTDGQMIYSISKFFDNKGYLLREVESRWEYISDIIKTNDIYYNPYGDITYLFTSESKRTKEWSQSKGGTFTPDGKDKSVWFNIFKKPIYRYIRIFPQAGIFVYWERDNSLDIKKVIEKIGKVNTDELLNIIKSLDINTLQWDTLPSLLDKGVILSEVEKEIEDIGDEYRIDTRILTNEREDWFTGFHKRIDLKPYYDSNGTLIGEIGTGDNMKWKFLNWDGAIALLYGPCINSYLSQDNNGYINLCYLIKDVDEESLECAERFIFTKGGVPIGREKISVNNLFIPHQYYIQLQNIYPQNIESIPMSTRVVDGDMSRKGVTPYWILDPDIYVKKTKILKDGNYKKAILFENLEDEEETPQPKFLSQFVPISKGDWELKVDYIRKTGTVWIQLFYIDWDDVFTLGPLEEKAVLLGEFTDSISFGEQIARIRFSIEKARLLLLRIGGASEIIYSYVDIVPYEEIISPASKNESNGVEVDTSKNTLSTQISSTGYPIYRDKERVEAEEKIDTGTIGSESKDRFLPWYELPILVEKKRDEEEKKKEFVKEDVRLGDVIHKRTFKGEGKVEIEEEAETQSAGRDNYESQEDVAQPEGPASYETYSIVELQHIPPKVRSMGPKMVEITSSVRREPTTTELIRELVNRFLRAIRSLLQRR